jgi:rod shape-determining protein MreC
MKNRSVISFLLIFLSIVGLAFHQSEQLKPIEELALYIIAPLQSRIASISKGIEDVVRTVRDFGELRRRNDELQELVNKLIIENVRLKELEEENERLRRLLRFTRTNLSYDYRAAEIVGRDPSNILRFLIINIGSEQGIEKGMPVVTERGLVGRIQSVGPNWAKVLLITDPSSSVSALVQSSRATGIVEGKMGGGLTMKYIPQGERIGIGDIVLTSGLGGNLPKGIIIGQVTSVHQSDIEMFQRAQIRPTVDFNKLEIVLVIINFEGVDGGE